CTLLRLASSIPFTYATLVRSPVSSSVTVAETWKSSEEVPVGLSSRYWWLALNESTPAGKSRVVVPSPVPQSMSTVWLSRDPGSANEPDRLNVPFSSIVPELSTTFEGATLFTVATVPAVPDAPWLSVTTIPLG